jgi:hypothetical protein
VGQRYNGFGQLGDGTQTFRATPAPMSGIATATAVSAGAEFSLMLLADHTLWSTGSDFQGQLGVSVPGFATTPQQISTLSNIVSVSAGFRYALATDQDGTVWAWGDNIWGQLGNGSLSSQGVPISLSLTHISVVAAGTVHSVAVSDDGVIWTWGHNDYGELGDGTTTDSYVPIAISGPNHSWILPRPSFSVGTGTYSTDKTVTITSALPDAEIHFTLNGNDPTQSDPTIASGGTVTIDRTRTLKARAWHTGYTTSAVASATYTMVVAPIVINPPTGLYPAPFTVSMSTSTSGATIFYTTDGTSPTQSSFGYDGPLTVTTPTTIQAYGVRPGWTSSDVAQASYQISLGTLDPPTFNPGGGSYT